MSFLRELRLLSQMKLQYMIKGSIRNKHSHFTSPLLVRSCESFRLLSRKKTVQFFFLKIWIDVYSPKWTFTESDAPLCIWMNVCRNYSLGWLILGPKFFSLSSSIVSVYCLLQKSNRLQLNLLNYSVVTNQ